MNSAPTAPRISVVIVSYNTRDILRQCLLRLADVAEGLVLQTLVVDNSSCDGSADMVAQEFPQIELIRSASNLGFAAANNLAFERARAELVLLLNPDALLSPGSLRRACDHLDAHPRLAMGGARLVGRDGRAEPSGRQFPSLLNEALVLSGLAARYPQSRWLGRFDRSWDASGRCVPVDWVPGAFALIRRQVLQQLGGFDERFFLYYEEVDLCRRLQQAGWQVWYWPDIEVHHSGGESSRTVAGAAFSKSGSQLTLWRMRSGLLYYRKQHGWLTARAVRALEAGWHRLRARRAIAQGQAEKAAESQRIVQLLAQAWRETDGGRIIPPRPW